MTADWPTKPIPGYVLAHWKPSLDYFRKALNVIRSDIKSHQRGVLLNVCSVYRDNSLMF